MTYRCGKTAITYFQDGPLPGRAWNPVEGCTPCSEGCENCYARAQLEHLGKAPDVTLYPDRLDAPSRIKEPSVIATCFQSDLFHEDVPDAFAFDVLWHMVLEPHHTFVVTTKRPERMGRLLCDSVVGMRARSSCHVWLGVTVENQARAEERLPHLVRLAEAGWNTWVSAEPLLGPLDLRPWIGSMGWVAAGCESKGAHLGRTAETDWFRSLRDQCEEFGVPFYLKQASGCPSGCSRWPVSWPCPDEACTQAELDTQRSVRPLRTRLSKRPRLDGKQHIAVPWGGDTDDAS